MPATHIVHCCKLHNYQVYGSAATWLIGVLWNLEFLELLLRCTASWPSGCSPSNCRYARLIGDKVCSWLAQGEEEAKAKEDRPVKDIFNFAMLTTSYKRHGGRDIGIQQSKGNCAATFFSKMKPMIEIKCAHGSNS